MGGLFIHQLIVQGGLVARHGRIALHAVGVGGAGRCDGPSVEFHGGGSVLFAVADELDAVDLAGVALHVGDEVVALGGELLTRDDVGEGQLDARSGGDTQLGEVDLGAASVLVA